jgi:hypothetical protein
VRLVLLWIRAVDITAGNFNSGLNFAINYFPSKNTSSTLKNFNYCFI